ncbi:hypothetical protein Q5424_06355 [Conexibacter sp. JD483]|uniref:hypothetical protein n=1 Tax=unclassified Conexibacter TaxID=2627773 RepID=UPI002722C5DF|nr:MULTISPECIES: hypothetical protein [unclassified Conexibacter]MDO8184821.1 hypothetical protein [Conexibacter sp. CPCC 205706]MDO8196596.1 hypothetical protein [Conexibacter sp. CPCC 205762]MDR9368691.1 hypothetical protein [Conexibacter sp. JD483]
MPEKRRVMFHGMDVDRDFGIDFSQSVSEPEAWWEWPGMFWRWSTGPIRRLVARLDRDA